MLKLSTRLLSQNSSILRQLTSKSCGIRLLNRNYSNPSYEGDGKTNCKVLNNDLEAGLMVNSYSQVNIELWFEKQSQLILIRMWFFCLCFACPMSFLIFVVVFFGFAVSFHIWNSQNYTYLLYAQKKLQQQPQQ